MASIKQILLPDGTTYDIKAKYADTAGSADYATTAGNADTARTATTANSAGSAQPVFNNNTWYVVGDDVQIGDRNVAGKLGIQGTNGDTGFRLYKRGDTNSYGDISYNGTVIGFNKTIYIPNNCAYDVFSRAKFTDLNTASAVLCANNGTFIRRYDNNNTAAQINASAFNTASSRLVKENIRPIDDEIIEKILRLDVKSFDYNGKTRVEKNQIGMIAEDVLDILPQFVHVPENYDEEETKRKLDNNEFTETLSIDYSNFVPALIKLVQMQQKQIDELKKSY